MITRTFERLDPGPGITPHAMPSSAETRARAWRSRAGQAQSRPGPGASMAGGAGGPGPGPVSGGQITDGDQSPAGSAVTRHAAAGTPTHRLLDGPGGLRRVSAPALKFKSRADTPSGADTPQALTRPQARTHLRR
jgi:hypothetical protein